MGYCGPRGIAHSTFLAWSPSDRDKALWWLIHDRQTCPGCGTRAEEWEGDRDAYVPEAHHCRGCEVKASADEWFERHRGEFRRGSSMRLQPRAVVEARAALAETEEALSDA
jgi:RNA polymerase subunit RPABC4/transcription elongation factor Spt4